MKPKTVGRVTEGQHNLLHAHELCHGIPVGLMISSLDTHIAVEHIQPGDYVTTRNGGQTRVETVEKINVFSPGVTVPNGAFGADTPMQNMVLPIDQPILIRGRDAQRLFGQNQAMVAAGQLTNGTSIVPAGMHMFELVRLIFDRPRVVSASGLELGTAPLLNMPLRAVA
ncbi:MAG: Hint domain-containing protein [Paracoccaceae bacterium]